jgi:hypothetical protein
VKNKKTVFIYEDKKKRGFHVHLLDKGDPVPADVIALDLVENGGKPHFSIFVTPIEANAIACGLMHAVIQHDAR